MIKTKSLIAACLTLFAVGAAKAADQRPNVLFIISDDLNTSLGCYGDPLVKSPNIDKLAARGMRFDRAYCQFPLCGPSRNSMLTGLYPNSSGIIANSQIFRQTLPDAVSLPQAFRREGYFVTRIGKMYHYNVPNSIGTDGHDDPASWELEINRIGVDRSEEHPKIFSLLPWQFGGTLSWHASPKTDEFHTDGLQAMDAEWVLERCAKDKSRPFFLALGFFRPHTPYVAPEGYFKNYPEENMPVVKDWEADQKDLPKAALGSHKKEHEKLTDDLRRQAVQAYYSSITFMDAQVGRVLKKLEQLGLAENTIVVFTSDHGYHLGEHGLWQKMSLFEQSTRVPLIIAAPGISKKGEAAPTPVGLIDLYPTLTAICGMNESKNAQGQNLAPILKDPTQAGRGWALSEVTRGDATRAAASVDAGSDAKGFLGYTLRTQRWRYTEWDQGKQGRELYDHDRDPKELTNLADDPAQAATLKELSAQLRDAVRSTFPASGRMPPVKEGMWAPVLVKP